MSDSKKSHDYLPLEFEVVRGVIYVHNKKGNVKTPFNFGFNPSNKEEAKAICIGLNAAYKAGFDAAINLVKASLDEAQKDYMKPPTDTCN